MSSSCKKRLAIKRTRSCCTLESKSFARRRSCSVLLLDSKNYPVKVNVNDIGGDRSRQRSIYGRRTIDAKMSHGNLQGYNCKYNRLLFSLFVSSISRRSVVQAPRASTTWKMSSDNGGFRLFDARQNKPRLEPRIAMQRDISVRSVACCTRKKPPFSRKFYVKIFGE